MENNTIGIDVGGTNIKIAWVENNHVSSQIIENNTPDNIDEFRKTIWDILHSLSINNDTRVGISIPGTVDYFNHSVELCPNLDYLNGLKSNDIINHPYTMIGNDADMTLLGEISVSNLWDQNIALVALGTGIGSSYFIGKSGPWQNNLISEIGHTKVASNGRKCTCGGLDCLETYFSGWSLLQQARQIGIEIDNIEELFDLALNNNQSANELIQQNVSYLGIALSDLANLTGISKIILSGKISYSYDIFIKRLHDSTQNCSHIHIKNNLQIIKSELVDVAPIIGAVALFRS